MPDEITSQASAGTDSNEPGGATPLETTPAPDTFGEPQPLSYAEAGEILDLAGGEKRGRDALEDTESADPLADPGENSPLEGEQEDEAGAETDPADTSPEEERPEDADPTHTDSDPDLPRRIRLDLERFSPRDAAILLHSRKTGKSLADAETELFGTTAPVSQQTPADAASMANSARLRREIDEMKAQRRRSTEDFDVKRQLELTERIEAASEALGEAQAQENAAASHRQSAMDSSALRVDDAYPDAFVPGTELSEAIIAELDRTRTANPAFLDLDDWPELIVGKVALRLGIAPRPATALRASAKTRPTPKAAAWPVASPAPGGRSGTRSPASVEAIRAELADAMKRGDGQKADRIIRQLEGAA